MATTTKRGFGMLPCPCCGEEQASVMLTLADDDSECFKCVECDADFSKATIREFMAKWGAVMTWLETMPVLAQ